MDCFRNGEMIVKFCHKCGEQLNDDSVFCPKCGQRQQGLNEENNNNTLESNINIETKDIKEAASNAVHQAVAGMNKAINSEKAQDFLGNIDKLTKMGFVGAIMGAASVFFPFISIAGIGQSTINENSILGIVLLIIAGFTAYGLKDNKFSIALAVGQTYLITVIIFLVEFNSQLKMASKKGIFGVLLGSAVDLDLGFYLLFLSAVVLMFVAGMIYQLKTQETSSVSGILNAIIALEKEIIDFKNIKLPTWAYSGILIVLLIIASSSK